jgi:peptide/nickel transport system ATP-binding protein/oligopeptide transport system ATP-binding protein
MKETLLDIKNLQVDFKNEDSCVHALRGVDFSIHESESVGLVGESGCGKSLTALSIMQLIQSPPGKISGGEIWFDNENLLKKTEKEMRKIRGSKISMIFQEPMTSLNPVFTIGNQLEEVIKLHMHVSKKESVDMVEEMLNKVGISDVHSRIEEYPHELSGGLRQRVMIAMALLCKPKMLIADEPTTALDVTIQAQILQLINSLKNELGTSVLMITHDLGVIAESCSVVNVMYAGCIVERGEVHELFKNPEHPYTKGLFSSIPVLGKHERLSTIPGMVPDLGDMPSGCAFYPRCSFCNEKCKKIKPELIGNNEHEVACWRVNNE